MRQNTAQIDTSVIIPTYNGAKRILNILRALQNQTRKDFEVVIVIDGSTDNTASVVKQYNSLLTIRVIEQENRGRGAVRNRGAKEASGNLLIFFDDDMIPLQDCVSKHIEHHQNYPGTILTGGVAEQITKSSTDMLRYKAFLSNKWTGDLEISKEGQMHPRSIFISAANFSVSKDVFKKIEGFDQRLNDAEDYDLAVRAYKNAIPLFFNISAFTWHDDIVTCASYVQRQRQYVAAQGKLTELKPWIATEGFIKPINKPAGFKKKVYQLFKSDKWVSAVDKNYFTILPRKLRYRLYDIIISANSVFF